MEHNKKEIKYTASPRYDNGFNNWQIHAQFNYRDIHLRLSDSLSGCGPVQMYRYSSLEKLTDTVDAADNFKFLFRTIIESAITPQYNNSDKWFSRTPTAITFVQGFYGGRNSKIDDNFISIMTELGFEHRIYQNIAHGLDTTDMQGFFYLDIKEKYINNKQ